MIKNRINPQRKTSRVILILMVASVLIIFVFVGFAHKSNNIANSNLPVNVTNELSAAGEFGFNFSSTMLMTNSSSMCILVQISVCDNNMPRQFACINSDYNQTYLEQKPIAFSEQTQVCPQFIMTGIISCVSVSGYCEVTDNLSLG